METIEKIKKQITENPVLIYMKGSPKFPSCGFSARAVEALMGCKVPFGYVDILTNPDIRSELPKYAQWPTFPQLWVKGELVGGCDIILEMYQKGELQKLLKEATEENPA
ncbi:MULTISPECIES: Grx4 family monothiol glutaredoxin [Pasteurellaceae]|uniref:Grx4 family monothiol glutaredoxin n=3 Tax=Pasteurellaceae TaxID=712 RepID=A0ACC6HP29_9PAST|nr:Grx4 family monothiol glutaredoxin [Pasteurella atlantica]MBR0573158.1 Grx4 family monothiol glutaredoxin [Pasteurella atlantica]MDP8038985.1 Grx4 family monothiol glutaredoxin [Pasteurella atlantica]MDP8041075.1 Grx4 family monothiol glutaredoxin [Pasteurella atlantica]MDP8043312.1 Grx4 family monothiol glutaredoxin [Pasteurella atlantica]MDP8045398.1 Grx4 family monothiol glutaredoxin [Pasteurella atlantica]